jgi:anaerobic selenocysteine-containing dehydrogenase
MGFTERELFESDAAMIETVMGQVGIAGSFDEFKAAGTIFPPGEPIIQFPDLAFPTPSGKLEIASDRAAADGHPRLPTPDVDTKPSGDKLRLLSPASPWLMNDSYANDARVAKQLGAATVTLHPEDAAARGLSAGQTVRLSNETGSLTVSLATADMIPRGVALSPKGRWPRQEDGGRANVNVLNPGLKSDMGESTCVHGVEVEIAAV